MLEINLYAEQGNVQYVGKVKKASIKLTFLCRGQRSVNN